jgi:hypothetical protein
MLIKLWLEIRTGRDDCDKILCRVDHGQTDRKETVCEEQCPDGKMR